MSDGLHIAEERVRRFERLGGVDLSRLSSEETHTLLAEVRTGVASFNKVVFRFCCPLCGNMVVNDQEMEPLCTGPSWTDDHSPEVMVRHG